VTLKVSHPQIGIPLPHGKTKVMQIFFFFDYLQLCTRLKKIRLLTLKAQWLLYVPSDLTVENSILQTVHLCVSYDWQKPDIHLRRQYQLIGLCNVGALCFCEVGVEYINRFRLISGFMGAFLCYYHVFIVLCSYCIHATFVSLKIVNVTG
jgi:hypothetical protein